MMKQVQDLLKVRGAHIQEILDIKEAAHCIGLTVSGLRRMLREGRGPAYFRAGRLIRFRTQDIERWIASRLVNQANGADEEVSQ